jgi:hypothetical protein
MIADSPGYFRVMAVELQKIMDDFVGAAFANRRASVRRQVEPNVYHSSGA